MAYSEWCTMVCGAPLTLNGFILAGTMKGSDRMQIILGWFYRDLLGVLLTNWGWAQARPYNQLQFNNIYRWLWLWYLKFTFYSELYEIDHIHRQVGTHIYFVNLGIPSDHSIAQMFSSKLVARLWCRKSQALSCSLFPHWSFSRTSPQVFSQLLYAYNLFNLKRVYISC